jgi:uncharacterized membrane protein
MDGGERLTREEVPWAFLSYFLVVVGPAIVLLARREALARFHALQSLLATLVLFAGAVILRLLSYVPIFGFLYAFLLKIYLFVVFLVWVFVLVQTLRGQRVVLPYVGEWAAEGFRTSLGAEEPSEESGDDYPPEVGV